ncbi:MAG: ribonuclease E inhibitor RraB, partial [Planctomycetota bacterium]
MDAPDERDLVLLRRLEELGADLGKPHTVDFFLYFSSEEPARSAASEIEAHGYVVSISRVPPPWWRRLFSKGTWACCASKTMVPNRETILETSTWFDDIAQRLGG